MKTPTTYEIKYNLVNEPYYFERKTMKAFGQTLKCFHVNKTDNPDVFYVWAKIATRYSTGARSERFYNAKTCRFYRSYHSATGQEEEK